MKSKLLLCLALVLGGYFAPLTVQAYWGLVPVDRANMDSTTPFVRMVSIPFGTTNDSRVAFSIYVLPKDKAGARLFSGNLAVKNDVGKFIASSPVRPKLEPEVVPKAVPKSWAGKCLVFEFSVAADHLSQSEFDLNETGDLKWGTSGIAFQFKLHEFAATPGPWHGFPILPPITNANPAIRLPLLVHVPTKLKIERASDTLSMEIDKSSLEATNLMVGTNLVTGVESKVYVYPDGQPRPVDGGQGLSGGLDFNLGAIYWHTRSDGLPLPGKKYVVELELTVFETDIPPQHAWSPYGKNYKVLWQRTLKQIVE